MHRNGPCRCLFRCCFTVFLHGLVEGLCVDFAQTLGHGSVHLRVVAVEVADESLTVLFFSIFRHADIDDGHHLLLRNQSACTYREDAQQRVVTDALQLQGTLCQSCLGHTEVEDAQAAGSQFCWFHLRE